RLLFALSSVSRPLPSSTLFPYTTLFRSLLVINRITPYKIDPVMNDQRTVLNFLPASAPCIHAGVSNHGSIASFETPAWMHGADRSEEHTSELQSRFDLVCRLLLEKTSKP